MIKNILFQQKPLDRGERFWLLSFAGLLTLLVLYPLWAGEYALSIMRDALIFGLFALSLDYLWGKAGLMSFGHAAFFGMGAYGMAIVSSTLQTPYASLIGLLTAVMVPGIVALLTGYFLIFAGVRGPYFVILTLALGLISKQTAISWVTVTGGDSGLLGIPPLTFALFDFKYELIDSVPLYFLVLGVAVVAILTLWIACRGRYGNILAAIQDNEPRASALGHNTSLYLLIVMVLSCMLAGFAGSLYATSIGFVAPDLIGLMLSTEVFVWVAIGGRGTLLGPFIGAFVVLRLQQIISSINYDLWPLLIGAFFVAMVFLFPDGVLSLGRYVAGFFGHHLKSNKREIS